MIDPEAISEARRALGRQLAARREAAGYKQQELAPLIHYGRSTLASAETGHSACSRAFWARCDSVLNAGGVLLRGYDELKALARSQQAEVARLMEQRRAAKVRQLSASVTADVAGADHAPDTVMLSVRVDGREVVVPLDRRLLLQAGVGTFLEAFALGPGVDALEAVAEQPASASRVAVTSPAQVEEILTHTREQWHALVRTDNLLGPRYALAGVLTQVAIVEGLLSSLRDDPRREAVRLGAQYAESAAWLYEDSGNLARARYWTSRAMEWAYEAGDVRMLAWTVFRRSQQAAATRDVAQAIGLARAARRDEGQLATPARAAIRVQEAYGHALDGNERTAQALLDEAHTWAASDTVGDAHEGHGSYCTPGHIEIQRAGCWVALGQPKKAIRLYEREVPNLPVVYQRNRATAQVQLAAAYLADGQIEPAASTAHLALPVARSSGAGRTVTDIKRVGAALVPHRSLPAVAALLDDLRREDA
jgi:hypothetical protein